MKESKILVVEDEVIISETLKESLESMGYYKIELAYNSEKAIDLIQQTDYDIILMDVNLGGNKDGIDVVNSIKNKFDLPIIYITGNSDEGTVERAKLSMPYGFLTKPVQSSELKIHLEVALHKQKVKRLETIEENELGSLYEGNCTGMSINLTHTGKIVSVTSHIRKITGKPSYFYKGKTIYNAGFSADTFQLLEQAFLKAKESSQRSFYGSLPSSYIGTRLVEIVVVENVDGEFQFNFIDLTEHSADGEEIKVAIASENQNITYGFKSVPSFGRKIRVSAELLNIDAVIDYLAVNKKSVLVLDVNMTGDCEDVLKYIKEHKMNNIKVLFILNRFEVGMVPNISEYEVSGYFSKLADDAVIYEALHSVSNDVKYEDPSLYELLNSKFKESAIC